MRLANICIRLSLVILLFYERSIIEVTNIIIYETIPPSYPSKMTIANFNVSSGKGEGLPTPCYQKITKKRNGNIKVLHNFQQKRKIYCYELL